MARGINKVILIGNLGADPELKYTAAGTPMCKFRMATAEEYKDRDGNKQERTEWHKVVTWAKLAEICGQYLIKGKQVYVEGSIRTRSWDKDDGTKGYMTEINAREVQFLGGGKPAPTASGLGGTQGSYKMPPQQGYGAPPDDDGVPF